MLDILIGRFQICIDHISGSDKSLIDSIPVKQRLILLVLLLQHVVQEIVHLHFSQFENGGSEIDWPVELYLWPYQFHPDKFFVKDFKTYKVEVRLRRLKLKCWPEFVTNTIMLFLLRTLSIVFPKNCGIQSACFMSFSLN